MPAAPLPLPAAPRAARPQLRSLLVSGVVVVALHLLLLQGMPGLPSAPRPAVQTVQVSGLQLQVQHAPAQASPAAPQARAQPLPAVVPRPTQRAQPDGAPDVPTPSAHPPAPTVQAGDEPAPALQASSHAGLPRAPAPPEPAHEPAAAPHPSGPAVEKAGSGLPTRFAPPLRLVYEGRGQERGFINYAGSAELSWQPQGANYQARLEISAFGLRLVSWTSKGALEDGQGLLPLRFGDRRRGPETATHFQRDKGIISFSANNPDVPLQPGAQDKLSMLLQLGALAAAAPEAFAPGRRVQFQAADAHGAQSMEFVAGPLQDMELPGGTLRVLPLTRLPTAEFDQKIEVWLGPEVSYLPVRLRITESNGTYSDLLWKRTQTPEPG